MCTSSECRGGVLLPSGIGGGLRVSSRPRELVVVAPKAGDPITGGAWAGEPFAGDGSLMTSASRSADTVIVSSVPPSDCSMSDGIGAPRGSPPSGRPGPPTPPGPSTAEPILNTLPLPLIVRCGVPVVVAVALPGSDVRRTRPCVVPPSGVPAAPNAGLPLEESGEMDWVAATRPDWVGGPYSGPAALVEGWR